MGQDQLKKIAILIICLLMTSGFIYLKSHDQENRKSQALAEAMKNIDGWQYADQSFSLDPKTIQALELDDYINYNYHSKSGSLSLYIGYYLTSKKVGAAHDPLVCFPGQGWVLSDRTTGKLDLKGKPYDAINYSSMIAQLGTRKELIVYWFQSYDKTSPDTFGQKIKLLWLKFLHKGGDNAFVRITVPLGSTSMELSRENAFDFIRSFYPQFLSYTING